MSNEYRILYVNTFEHLGDEFIVGRFEDSNVVGASIIYQYKKDEIDIYNLDANGLDETREEQLQIYEAIVDFICGKTILVKSSSNDEIILVKSVSDDELIEEVAQGIIDDREYEVLCSCGIVERRK